MFQNEGTIFPCEYECFDLPKVTGSPMNYDQVLRTLYAEKEKLDRVIASLEKLQSDPFDSAAPQKQGRKSMGEEERREVSTRMKRFWAERRKPHPTRP
jgi:hypothetical protein